jgi:ubiquinone/menaquinone biosynthesis C-methylase UbiE
MSTSTPTPVPNHHAHYPGFAGLGGLVAALSMSTGRRPTARLAADLVDLTAADRLLDIGCGPGAAVREAARRGAAATGVDPARVMRRVARSIPARGSCRWLEGRAELLPAADGSQTVVWSLATVHHWADLDAGLAESLRVLGPGGRFLAIERLVHEGAHGLASHGWTTDQAEAFGVACRDSGFVDVTVSTHPLGRGPVLAVRATRP